MLKQQLHPYCNLKPVCCVSKLLPHSEAFDGPQEADLIRS